MCKFYFKKCWLITGALLWLQLSVMAQQLKLGNNPSGINKAAVLELESSKQGLLLTRVSDTSAAPLNTAPDGMLIYFTVDKTLLIRKDGFWRRLIDVTSVTAAAPVFYNKGVVVSNNVKIWADTLLNNVSPGTPTANYAAAGFTKIMSITATAVGGTGFNNTPIVSISSYNLTSVKFILLQNHHTDLLGLLSTEGLQLHTTTTTKILFTVIGY